MDLSDLDLKPKDVDEADWEAFPPGARLRVVRDHQYELELTARQYEALARLPYWMLYGPEHGAPRDWFNLEGYLLPKYRPGGPRFAQFRAWRRTYRGRRLLLHRRRERGALRRERKKNLDAFLDLGVLAAALVLGNLVTRAWLDVHPPLWRDVLAVGIALALYWGGGLLLGAGRSFVARRIVGRLWAERVRRMESRTAEQDGSILPGDPTMTG